MNVESNKSIKIAEPTEEEREEVGWGVRVCVCGGVNCC